MTETQEKLLERAVVALEQIAYTLSRSENCDTLCDHVETISGNIERISENLEGCDEYGDKNVVAALLRIADRLPA